MKLVTLQGLHLTGSSYKGKHPLVLLAYLAIEGPTERRALSELFWPDARDPLNSLSAALTRLRKHAPGFIEADEVRVWTTIRCDVHDLQEALESDDADRVLGLHERGFLDGVFESDWGVGLEGWVLAQRDLLGEQVRRCVLRVAESEAALGRFGVAASYAEAAFSLVASGCEPEELARLFVLLRADDRALAAQVKDEAAGFGIALELRADEARGRLQRLLIGRESERQQLLSLREGEWAWVRSGPGLGKTTLLRSLPGVFLTGRAGLPYATLEPLIKSVLHEGEAGILQHLRGLDRVCLIDNWERMDAESQHVVRKLRGLGSRLRLVISSRLPPVVLPDVSLELGRISRVALARYEGAWEETQGLPGFVNAFLRKQPLFRVLEDRLEALSEPVRRVYLALGLLEHADLVLVRQALGLSASEMAAGVDDLLAMGLIEPSGQVRLRQATLTYLEAHPTILGPLALTLARFLEPLQAFDLYRLSRGFWGADDEEKVQDAYVAYALELLRRGFPQRAAGVLREAPASRGVTLLMGKAFEKAGQYQEAFEVTRELSESAEVLSLRATLFERLGRPEDAREAAERALFGSTETRAESCMTLGRLHLSQGEFVKAGQLFKQAARLWRALGRQTSWAEALNNEAVALSKQGKDAQGAFEKVLEAVGDNLALQALVKLNLGREFESQGKVLKAVEAYEAAIPLAETAGAIDVATRLWNNLGVCFESSDVSKAVHAYRQALKFAQQSGEKRTIGMVLANLAALELNYEAWQEAMYLLDAAGHAELIEVFWQNLPENHVFLTYTELNV